MLQVVGDDAMGLGIGIGDVAGALFDLDALRQEGEGRCRVVAGLDFEHGVINAAPVDARRGAGLQSGHWKPEGAQAFCQSIGRGVPGASGGITLIADVDAPGKKGAGGQDHCASEKFLAILEPHPCNPAIFYQQIAHTALKHL